MIEPNPAAIRSYLKKWDTAQNLENYRIQEEALKLLFHKFCPENTCLELVLIKVTALNKFYSTNIYDTYSMAKHILEMRVDERLKNGDLSLVNELALITIKEKHKNFYSFASKYCSHHVPEKFPIYDTFVEKMLLHYSKKSCFSMFKKAELKKYDRFVEVIKAFQRFYGLNSFSVKQIDIFLWLVGRERFSPYISKSFS
jgi:hypothetical protein